MTTSAPLVLVADDEPSMLELVARHLRTMSDPKVEVIQASDGEEAWRLAREHLPDLVVLDVMMPGMSGWEVCRKIRGDEVFRELLSHTGVVMLTGIGENLNQMTSPLYGADAYIDKPFEFDDFDEKVRDTLRARESKRLAVVRPTVNGTSGGAKAAPSTGTQRSKKKAAATPTKKEAATKKPAAKKAATKKAATKKVATKKPAAKKAATKKPAAKKVATKKPAAKKAATKKPAAKRAATKKPAAKKKAATKKPAAKKKAATKKPAAKKKAGKKR